jgi:uncharacterized membrane protein
MPTKPIFSEADFKKVFLNATMKAVVVLALLAVIGVAIARDVTSAQFKVR